MKNVIKNTTKLNPHLLVTVIKKGPLNSGFSLKETPKKNIKSKPMSSLQCARDSYKILIHDQII